MIYLDNHATTPCDPRVLEAMLPWFTREFGNPHSAEHAMGQRAATAVERARAQVAELIGAEAREIVFTSGATEANNIAIKGAAHHAARHGDPGRRRVVTLATEHKCVLESVRDLRDEGFEPVILPVDPDGRCDPARIARTLREKNTLLVSVMAANNEIGTLQDLRALSAIAHENGALFHTDAAQAAGRVPLEVDGIDLMSLTAHKMYGPKGVGALFVRRRPRVRLAPLFSGGGQERGVRSGTLPTPLVVGFGLACAIAAGSMKTEAARIGALRDEFYRRLAAGVPGLRVNGGTAHRLPGNLNVVFPAATAEALIQALPELCMSTGSACSSAAIEPSYVLRAIGLEAGAASRSLRLGLGRFTSQADIAAAAEALIGAHAALAATVAA